MLFVVRFSTTSDLISWTIRRRTDFFVSHVEFQVLQDYVDPLGKLHKAGSTLGSRYPDGVKWREPKENADQKDVVVMTRPKVDEAALWVQANRIGYGYDLPGIFGIASGDRDWHDKNKRFCSEVNTEGFEAVGENLFNPWAKIWEITPRDEFLAAGWTVLIGPERLKRVTRRDVTEREKTLCVK